MRLNIAIYIPNYNGGNELQKVQIPYGFECFVMDNSSSDDSEEICRRRGFHFIKNNVTVGRTLNWMRCLNHFKISNYDWMKWLFIGDTLSEESGIIMKEAAEAYKDSGVIIFDYNIERTANRIENRCLERSFEGKWSNRDTLKRVIEIGNVFGAPIATMISKNAAINEVRVDDLEWSADTYMHMLLSKDIGASYCAKTIGTFKVPKRKTYIEKSRMVLSRIEELEVQRRTYQLYRQLFQDDSVNIDAYALNKMKQCLEDNSKSISDNLSLLETFVRSSTKYIYKLLGARK